MTKITIIDYGAGNLKNLKNAFDFLGASSHITGLPTEIEKAEKLVLPGVGAFGFAMKNLKTKQLEVALLNRVQQGVALMGICLGMQLLLSESEEGGTHVGLGLIPGKVKRFRIQEKVPHVGWNTLKWVNPSPITSESGDLSYAYFVHSYYCEPENSAHVINTTNYEIDFASMIQKENIFGVQFHPEKSQEVGLAILKKFVEY